MGQNKTWIYDFLKNTKEDCLLLVDDGYSISPWLMTPWGTPATPAQQNYNRIFCRERVVIDGCFE